MLDINDGNREYLSQTFKGLDLAGAVIEGREFDGCSFRDCNFDSAVFRRCRFIDCQFSQCNLSLVDIGYSRFSEVSFEACKLVGVNWTRADWPNLALSAPIAFHQCVLNDASFFGLSLEELVLESCKAHDADFRDGNFSGADFRHSDFHNSLFDNSNLAAADFTEASNYHIDVTRNAIKGAKFTRLEATSLLESLGIELFD